MRILPVHREYIAIVHSSSGQEELKKVPFNIFEYALRKYLGFYSNTHFKNVYSKAFTDTLKNPSILREIGKEQLENIEKKLEGVEKEKREEAKQIKLNKLIEEKKNLYFTIFQKANDRKINAFIGNYQISGCAIKISGNYQWNFKSLPLIHSVNFQFNIDKTTHDLVFTVKPIEGLSIPVQRIVSFHEKSLDNTYDTPNRIVVELPPLLFGEMLDEDAKKLEERLLSKETAVLMSVIRKMRKDSKEAFYYLAKHHALKKNLNKTRSSQHMGNLGWELVGDTQEKINSVMLKHDVYLLKEEIDDKAAQQLPYLSLEFAQQYLVPYGNKVRVSRLEPNNLSEKTQTIATTVQIDLMNFEGMEASTNLSGQDGKKENPVLIDKTKATPPSEQMTKFERMETSLI